MPIDWRPNLISANTGKIDFRTFEEIYEEKVFPMFKAKHGVNKMFMRFGGNRIFLIQVPESYRYNDEFYYIHVYMASCWISNDDIFSRFTRCSGRSI